MEFSVERSINTKKRQTKVLRQEMIKKEKLHIHDIIDYQQFLELYNQYGQGLSKEDFGEIYLDLSRGDYYSLKKNRCRILKNEEIDDEYICFIKQYVIKNFGLEKGKTVSYEEIQQMYQSIFTKLSETLFAEKILDISSHSLSCIKYDKTDRATIFTSTDDTYFRKEIPEKAIRKEIRRKTREANYAIKEIKNTVAEDRKLHIGDKISYSQFQEIYEIYGKELYTEYDFAKTILGISEGKAKNLIHKKIEEVEIWKNETLDLDSLLEIREGVIKSEGLHIKDEMTYEQFQRLYEKYAGKLSEEMFAEEILDISRVGFKNLKKGKSPNSIILGDIDISEEIKEKVCQEIKKNEHIYKGKRISYEEFLYLYRKYAFVIKEIDFAEKILKINVTQFRELKKGKCKTTRVFNTDDFEVYDELELRQLRDIVIKEKIAKDKQFEKLEDRCIDIVDDFKETKRSREQIMEYIKLCQEKYAEDLKNMPRKTMETLQSVLEYLNSTNMTYNTFFIKACISQKNYTSANRFITFCMQKPDLTVQEKKDLQELRTMIREAIKINEARELINLNRSIPEIMMQTGMNEVDIVKMKKHIQASQKLANENHKKIPVSPQEDWCQ